MNTSSRARSCARTCGIALAILTVLFLLLAVLPYYANGMHLRPYPIDPKECVPFVWLGYWSSGIAALVAGWTPLLSLVLVPITALGLGLRWGAFVRRERQALVAAVAVNVVTLALTLPAIGTIGIWLAD